MISIMFRRNGLRRRPRKQYKKVMHLPSSMGNSVASSTSVTFFAANAGTFNTTASGLNVAREALSNRQGEVTIASKIFRIVYDITIQPDTQGSLAGGAIEYVVFKIERSAVVPTTGAGLPTDIDITTLGLQAAFRQVQPGRVLVFGQIPYTEQTTNVRTIVGRYGKYKLSTMRTGDWYGIMLYNRAANAPNISIQSRFNECI